MRTLLVLALSIICQSATAQMPDESLYGNNPLLQHILTKQYQATAQHKTTATKQRLVGCAYTYHTEEDSIWLSYSGSRGSGGFDFTSHSVLHFPTQPFPEQVMKFDRIHNVPYGDDNCYTYDAQENAISQNYCSGGSQLWTYITNTNGRRSLVERVDSNLQLLQDKYSFAYNTSGSLIQYTILAAPSYDSVRKAIYTYNSTGLMASSIAYNKQGGSWLATDSTINTYDGQGRLTESIARDDMNISISTYSYIGSTGKVYAHKFSVYPVNPGQGCHLCHRYSYDANDRVVLLRTVDCTDTSITTERKVNKYDSLDNVIERTYQMVLNGNPQSAFRVERYYYENYQTTTVGDVATGRLAIQVYPNPANNLLNLDNVTAGTVTISSMVGQVVLRKQIMGGNVALDISALQPGSYIINLQTIGGARAGSARFIKN